MRKPTYSIAFERVNPKQAKAWLAEAEGYNVRGINVNAVTTYSNDMRAGEWQPIPVAICFDKDGILVNGQHRLAGIVESDTTQLFLVARGVGPEVIAAMDQGLKRSVTAVASTLGHKGFTSNFASTTRLAAWGPNQRPASAKELISLYLRFKDAIDFAIAAPGQRFSAIYGNAWARAAMMFPDRLEELRHHGRVFSGSLQPVLPGNDRFMFALNKYATQADVGGRAGRVMAFHKTDRALLNALKASAGSDRLVAVSEPDFPLLSTYLD
jgi:hypothetical protein